MADKTDSSQAPGRARRAGRAFIREIVVPIALALVFVQFAVQAFKIPSASMENSLRIGDFLLGLKFVYGSPIPYSNKRLPALSEPKPGDVVIFRYPGDPFYPEGKPERYRFVASLLLFGNLYWDRTPGPGEKSLVWYAPKDFIKRIVAKSGQTIEVEGASLRVDGNDAVLPREGRYAAGTGSLRAFEPVRDHLRYRLPVPGETIALDTLSLTQAAWLRSIAIQENPDKKVELKLDLFRGGNPANDYVMPWLRGDARDRNHQAALFYLGLPVAEAAPGLLQVRDVPFARVQDLARTGYLRAADLMPPALRNAGGRREEFNEYYMGNYLEVIAANLRALDTAFHVRARLVVDGVESDRYTVREPLYFMMGDNRDNSSDSRYWGPLSRRNVKARALIVYYSFEDEEDGFSFTNPLSWLSVPLKIRWTRIGRLID
ncbi:MAG TPA: signal peptidase I [Fibrobacteria bacterium]|nr:signal peptidase I [Fibrobacteria bacterium]